MSEKPKVEIQATAYFRTNLKMLVKRYRGIRKDLQPVLDQLSAGEIILWLVYKNPLLRRSNLLACG